MSREIPADHLDVLIVGAGLAGVGAACHLQQRLPGKSYAILEAREEIGGTWDLFRYPGIRSDSDMHTLGYRFRPWTATRTITDGPSILRYIRETAEEYGVSERIRFRHRVLRAEWSSEEARWTVEAEDGASDEPVVLTCDFLWVCSGYYRYDEGYTPDFEGLERFRGEVVHPQHWPDDLDYSGKQVIVIGSGATAVTLVPALAERAARVTMLQRSPTYIASLPAEDPLAKRLRRLLPHRTVYAIVRWKNVLLQMLSYQLSRRWPWAMKALIRRGVRRALPAGYDIDTHFNPTYDPWDQRLCLVPDGDLFESISAGRVEIVTDRISSFTETGVALESGGELEADLIVTATGLNLLFAGGIQVAIDGSPVELPARFTYKGMMLSGIPNFAFTVGYTNASWTLKADLVCEYLCRLLAYIDSRGYHSCVPEIADSSITEQPLLDLSSGYVLRSLHLIPRQGSRTPWRLRQNYPLDLGMFRFGPLEDGTLRFSRRASSPGSTEAASSGLASQLSG